MRLPWNWLSWLHLALWDGGLAFEVHQPGSEARFEAVSAQVEAGGRALIQNQRYVRKEAVEPSFNSTTSTDLDLYQLNLLDGAQNGVTKEAIVTHICNKDWAPGALALAASLRSAGTSKNLVLMVSEQVGRRYRHLFSTMFDKVYIEEPVRPHDSITRDGADCVTLQMRAWQLPYKKVLYMDADVIVLKTHDQLLESSELTARQDSGRPGEFNGGMFVIEPSDSKFHELRKLLRDRPAEGSNGGIQQFLNSAFPACIKPSTVGCWKGQMEDSYNKFTRDVNEDDLNAQKFASLHYSGDWGGSAKPWMSGCLRKSDSVTQKENLQSKILGIWLSAFHQVNAPDELKDLLHTDCPADE